MTTQRDYYEILGLKKGASVDEVKRAYRQLAMQFHPDRVPEAQKKEAEEKFKEISESYAVLSDEKKKALYDQYGHSGIDSRYSTEDIFRGADFGDIFGGSGAEAFSSIFEDLGFDVFGSGGRSGRRRSRRGEDLQMEVEITLEEAYAGTEKEMAFNHYQECSQCHGSGSQHGAEKDTCPTCRGRGVVSSGMGFISFAQTCHTCAGEGAIIKNKCLKCRGEGREKAKKTVKVNIPGGVETGSVLRLRSEGNYSSGGKGDLYLHIVVRPHRFLTRNGDTLVYKMRLGAFKAMLGSEIEVPTLTGKVKMCIPAGTQPNSVFRLKGKGMPDLHTKKYGDQLVEVEIEIPQRLSARERALLLDVAKMRHEE